MVLDAQEITIGGAGVEAHQDGPAGLEDLVVDADADGREVLGLVDEAGLLDRPPRRVVDRSEAQALVVQDVFENLLDAPERGVPRQHQRQDELTPPRRGDGQIKQNVRLVRRRVETGLQRVGSPAGVAIQKRAADRVAAGQFTDRLAPGQDPNRQVLTLVGSERPNTPTERRGKKLDFTRRQADVGDNHTDSFRSAGTGSFVHPSHRRESVCFLGLSFPCNPQLNQA